MLLSSCNPCCSGTPCVWIKSAVSLAKGKLAYMKGQAGHNMENLQSSSKILCSYPVKGVK